MLAYTLPELICGLMVVTRVLKKGCGVLIKGESSERKRMVKDDKISTKFLHLHLCSD